MENNQEELEKKEEETLPEQVEEKQIENNEGESVAPLSPEVDFETTVEEKRKNIHVLFKKSQLISRIVMGIVLVALIGAIFLITLSEMAFKITGYSIAGAVLVGMFIYYLFTKNKFPNESKKYINEVTSLFNGYAFSDERYKDIIVDVDKKITAVELNVDRAYQVSGEVGSRNFVKGKFNNKQFEVGEIAIYNPPKDRKSPRSVAFLGKYLVLDNNYKFDGRYIFDLHGSDLEKLVDQPTDIEDLQVINEEENLKVYSSNDKAVKEVFGTEFLKLLKGIKIENHLLNLVIVVWAGHTAVYMSYDDPVTVIPFTVAFAKEGQEQYRNNLIQVLELLGK